MLCSFRIIKQVTGNLTKVGLELTFALVERERLYLKILPFE